MIVSLFFHPDGQVRCLYTEALNLAALGKLNIARASAVEFDNATQRWQVLDCVGEVLFTHPSRQACLDWEQDHLYEAAA